MQPGAQQPAYRGELPFLMLTALFIAALVVCNLVAGKFVQVDLGFADPFTLSVGILPYPVTFLVTDILSEIYGRRRANQVVLSGFVASVFVLGVLELGKVWPAMAGSRVDDASYDVVFGTGWRVILASMIAYLVAQLVDIRVFHFWRRVTKGKHLWLRNNFSTMFSQLVDTTLVVSVLFVGVWPAGQIAGAIWDGWIFKILCALADTPLCYLAIGMLDRHIRGRGGSTAADLSSPG